MPSQDAHGNDFRDSSSVGGRSTGGRSVGAISVGGRSVGGRDDTVGDDWGLSGSRNTQITSRDTLWFHGEL